METSEIFERLTQLSKTVETTIYGGKGWYEKWIVKLLYKNDADEVTVECQSQNAVFEEALKSAWHKLDSSLSYGVGTQALLPPIEHEQLEHKPAPALDDEIPF